MNASWPIFMRDRKHAGRSPHVGGAEGRMKWKLRLREGIFSSFAIGSDGTIYVGGDGSGPLTRAGR